MSQLIQLRQRIRAIETIQKITHAMRLIAMSTHSRLRNQQNTLTQYLNAINKMFAHIKQGTPDWKNSVVLPSKTSPALIILIGSQKGLCGNFNNNLFTQYTTFIHNNKFSQYHVIAVGKKVIEFVESNSPKHLVESYEEFTHRNLFLIAKNLVETINNANLHYSSVTIISNVLKTFFIQKPQVTALIPFQHELFTDTNHTTPLQDYIWEHQPTEVLDFLAMQYLESHLQHALFQSLLAEHAARFLSMDTANRNAHSLLETKKIEYNKLRQAKITKELAELSGSF